MTNRSQIKVKDIHFILNSTIDCLDFLQPANFNALRQLRNAPPSHIAKTKSAKVKIHIPQLGCILPSFRLDSR